MKDKPIILIVDDQPQNIELLESYLVPQGYEIVQAANGEEALGKLSDNQIDLILLDVMMPGMDGFEVTRRVRQDNTLRLLPIILVTVLRETEDRVKGIEAGCDDFISIPVDKTELLTRVRSLLKVKAYNDMMINYRKELESEVTSRTEELKHTMEKLQHDITERKRAEEALSESEKKYRQLVSRSPDGIFVIDLYGVFLSVNKAMCDNLKYTEEELLLMKMWDIVPEQYLTLHKQRLVAIMNGESTNAPAQYEVVGKDGNAHFVEVLSVPYYKENKIIGFQGIARDITERKRAEEELRFRNIILSTQQEASIDGILVVDEDGTIVSYNHRFIEMWDIPTELVEKKADEPVLSFVSNKMENPQSFLQRVQYLYEHKQETSQDEIILKNGRIFDRYSAPMVGPDDRYYGRVWYFHDISKRKQLEFLQNAVYQISQETDRAETLYDLYKSVHDIVKTVMHAENFYIALYDEQKDLISFPYFVDEFDVAPLPVKPRKGLTEYVFRTGKSLLGDEATFTRLSQQGEVELIGVPSPIWLGTPLIADAKTIGVMVVQDYHDPKAYSESDLHMLEYVSSQVAKSIQHKREEGKLLQSEEQFRLISENVADLIAVLDLEGRRVYNSPMYKNIIGDPNELRGTDSFQEIHPDDREKIKAVFQETVKTGIGQRSEYRFIKKDGTITYIESQGSVIRDKDGKITNVVVVSRDVTEKKKLEQQFLRGQRMESIGTLAGGIAHDLNNVLAPILLSVEYLRKMIKDETVIRTLDALESSAKRGANIIKQVLTFARGIEYEKSIIQLKHLISEMENIIKETFPRSIHVDLEIVKELWPIKGDATNLHQVLLNLCVNARDAMPNGGKLKLAAENIEIDENSAKFYINAKPGRYVVLSVSDTGTGIPKDIVDKIFDPFFTTKPIGEGTGLGLSTVHTIVRSHGGFINVYSETGIGTTFKAYLPATELGQTAKTGSKAKEIITGNGELILVVDDEASICEVTHQMLEVFGYRGLTAPNGAEAIVIYKSRVNDIALVITDMMMPVMDGPQTIRELHKINPTVKIIASSGLMESYDTERGIEHFVDAFITKPYTAEKLLEIVHSVLHKK